MCTPALNHHSLHVSLYHNRITPNQSTLRCHLNAFRGRRLKLSSWLVIFCSMRFVYFVMAPKQHLSWAQGWPQRGGVAKFMFMMFQIYIFFWFYLPANVTYLFSEHVSYIFEWSLSLLHPKNVIYILDGTYPNVSYIFLGPPTKKGGRKNVSLHFWVTKRL